MQQTKKALLKLCFKESIEDSIIDVIASSIQDYELENIAAFINNPKFKLLYPNDYFKVKYNSFDPKILSVNIDTMIDLSLFENGFIYGTIITSDTWSSTFNPYYSSMKCYLFLHDDDLKVIKKEFTINTRNLIAIDKSEIKYFEYGQDITTAS
jgi:hypothetical protein